MRKKLSFVVILEDECFLQGSLGWQQRRGGSREMLQLSASPMGSSVAPRLGTCIFLGDG